MKVLLIKILLLMSLAFNISHDSIIAEDDGCAHESVVQYILEQNHTIDCGDVCDFHHLFHFIAIIQTVDISPSTLETHIMLSNKEIYPPSTLHERNIKPPIV